MLLVVSKWSSGDTEFQLRNAVSGQVRGKASDELLWSVEIGDGIVGSFAEYFEWADKITPSTGATLGLSRAELYPYSHEEA